MVWWHGGDLGVVGGSRVQMAEKGIHSIVSSDLLGNSAKWFILVWHQNHGGFESGLLLQLFMTPYPPRNPPLMACPQY